ncbi:hypothetical protein [Vibrio sp. 10N.261.54.A5]|uniref:hypothetical protein n=1 Tax=Vibrio sp. 10N.261.54.A5 TaxID=3229686 RepID=UPI003552A8E1
MSKNEVILSNSGIGEFVISLTPDIPMIIVTIFIGISSVINARTVNRITKDNQKQHGLQKRAEIRQKWQDDFKLNISELVSLATIVNLRCRGDKAFSSTSEYFELWQKLFHYQTRITLMMDEQKDYATIIDRLVEDVFSHAADTSIDTKGLAAYSNALVEQSQTVIEKAWQDINKDLG